MDHCPQSPETRNGVLIGARSAQYKKTKTNLFVFYVICKSGAKPEEPSLIALIYLKLLTILYLNKIEQSYIYVYKNSPAN